MNWEVEEIPDEDFLYTRVSLSQISKQDGNPRAQAFLNTPYNQNSKNLSSDWNKYCLSAEDCKQAVFYHFNSKGERKNPNMFLVWEMNVGKIRIEVIPPQEVNHDPIFNHDLLPNNRAHSIIIGNKTNDPNVNNAEFRSLLIKIGKWA
jgi:hypothetical protein